MPKFYVEYKRFIHDPRIPSELNDGRVLWCVVEAADVEHVKRICINHGAEMVRAEELYKSKN